MNNQIRIGDMIWIKCVLGIKHYGICAKWNSEDGFLIVHNSKNYGVILTSFESFSDGCEAYLEKRADLGHEHDVANQALGYLGQRYNLLHFNCEHLANAAHGEPMISKQIKVAGKIIGGALALLGAVYVHRRPTFDERSGRYRNRSGRFAKRPFI